MTDPAPTTTTSPTTEHEPGLATTSGATTANVHTDDSNDTSNSREELRKTSGIPGVFSDVISFAKGVFSDFSQPLASQSLVTRLCCFPCQCGLACSHSCISLDFDSIMTILCCCPCRTFCVVFPTPFERAATVLSEPEEMPFDYNAVRDDVVPWKPSPIEEGEEIAYAQVFEIERKKREFLRGDSKKRENQSQLHKAQVD